MPPDVHSGLYYPYVQQLKEHANPDIPLPKGIVAAYDAAVRKEGSTEKIFLETGGLGAWCTYYRATRSAHRSRHYSGQGALRQTLLRLDRLLDEDKRSIATQLRLHINPRLEDKCLKRIPETQRGIAAGGTLVTAGESLARENSLDTLNSTLHGRTGPNPLPWRRQTSFNLSRTESSTPNTPDGRNDQGSCNANASVYASPNTSSRNPGDDSFSPSTRANQSAPRPESRDLHDSPSSPIQHVASFSSPWGSREDYPFPFKPTLQNIAAVFPPYLTQSIKEMPGQGELLAGSLTMWFIDPAQVGRSFGSVMSLEIKSHKVQHLAHVFFGVHIESNDTARYMLMPSGLVVMPEPELKLRGCKREMLLELFGPDVQKALIMSPAYKEEEEHGSHVTQTVTLAVSAKPYESAWLHLTLDEKEGIRVKSRLFRT